MSPSDFLLLTMVLILASVLIIKTAGVSSFSTGQIQERSKTLHCHSSKYLTKIHSGARLTGWLP